MLSRNLSRVSVALLLGSYLALAQTPVGPVTFTYDGPPLNIPHTENSIATFVSIPVSAVATVTKVTATVNISYAPVSDLNIYLFSPDGTRTRLLEKNCVGINATLVNMTFDDSASTTYNSFCPAEAGRGPWRGNEPLANFANKPAAGTWTLAVQNNSTPGNSGVLNGFSLTLSGTSPLTPTLSGSAIYNAVTSLPGPIAPGEIIAITGTTIGPATAVTAPAGNLPTTLGGVTVMINGNLPVPLAFVSSTLVLGIVPYTAGSSGAVIGGTVQVGLQFNGAASNTVTIGIGSGSPGVFTVSRTDSAATQVKAINADGTLNGPSNPAAAGSTIVLYAAGLGPVTPTFTAGQVAPADTLYPTVSPTFISIAGQTGTVLFSGLAPGTRGAYQVNAQVPSDVPSGAQQILLWNQGGVSQNGIVIYIK